MIVIVNHIKNCVELDEIKLDITIYTKKMVNKASRRNLD
jgi:hypothetical protein